MGGLASKQRREKTNAANKVASYTMNAPGNVTLPYGKLKVTISGRGQTGNSTQPGTVASYNPGSGGNYAGTNPGSGGNPAGSNPSTPGNSYYNPATYTPGNYVAGNTNPGSTVPGNSNPPSYSEYVAALNGNCSPGWSFAYYTYDELDKPHKVCSQSSPGTSNPPSYSPGNSNPSYTNPAVYSPGNQSYNPATPGNAIYNPYTPGNAYYNTYFPGNANYNPTIPGNAGSPATILGVYFPGGPAGSTAPVVGDTYVTVPYSSSPISITVPPGGYVTIKQQ